MPGFEGKGIVREGTVHPVERSLPAAPRPAPARAGRTMPWFVAGLLDARDFGWVARLLLTLVFWSSGLAKLLDFRASAALMEGFGLHSGWAVNLAVLLLQIGASALIILNRQVWLAAGALAVFTLLTIPVAHPFWAKSGEEAFRDLTVALEHVSLVGGLMLAAMLERRPRHGW
ncbi:DoxX family protein [Roseomonas mucosa]